jgi:hypothetical protein
MGKPLKSKHLNKHKRLRDQVLSRQGVADGKRKRLGHSGHFAKVEHIPIVRKPKVTKDPSPVAAAAPPGKKKKSKFNKFKHEETDGLEQGGTSQEFEPQEQTSTEKPKEGLEGRLPGESFTKFMKRLNKDTQAMLVKQAAKATKVTEKRKNFLSERKKQKKLQDQARKRGIHRFGQDSNEDEDAPAVSEAQIQTAVRAVPKFGEQAERPPIIRMNKPLKGLYKAPVSDSNSTGGSYIVGGMPALPELSGNSIKKAQMEALRKNAVSLYRQQMQKKRESKGLLSFN